MTFRRHLPQCPIVSIILVVLRFLLEVTPRGNFPRVSRYRATSGTFFESYALVVINIFFLGKHLHITVFSILSGNFNARVFVSPLPSTSCRACALSKIIVLFNRAQIFRIHADGKLFYSHPSVIADDYRQISFRLWKRESRRIFFSAPRQNNRVSLLLLSPFFPLSAVRERLAITIKRAREGHIFSHGARILDTIN